MVPVPVRPDNRPKPSPGFEDLHRMVRRTDGWGFVAWLEIYLDDHRAHLANADVKIYGKALDHINGLVWDSYDQSKALEVERVAHRSERLANIELSRRNGELEDRVKLLERQLEQLNSFIDSGEISLP